MTATAALALLLVDAGAAALAAPPSAAGPSADLAGTRWMVPILHTAGVLAGSRLLLSLIWPAAYDPLPFSSRLRQFGLAYTSPPDYRRDRSLLESDGDPWAINVVGHGLLGAEAYGRVRTCGGGFWQALAFTTAASAVWEYGIESWNKRPSAVDLIATPLLGAALGETRHQLRSWLGRKPRARLRRAIQVLVDPLGEGKRVLIGTRC